MKFERQHIVVIVILLSILTAAGAATYFFLYSDGPIRDTAALRRSFEVPEGVRNYTDETGTKIELSQYYGKSIIVYSWASWCPQCHQGLQDINEFAATPELKDIVVVAINRAENTLVANRFLDTLPALPNLKIIIDPSDHMFKSVEGYAMPELIVYDQAGEIVLHQRGDIDLMVVQSILDTN